MKKNLMQRYGVLLQIPNKAMISSSFCCDNRLDFGQCLKTCFFFVARYHKNGSGSRCFQIFLFFHCCFKNILYLCNEYDKQTGMYRQNLGEQKHNS